jgi:hypothetical protein
MPVQFLDLEPQQGGLLFMLRPGNNLRAVERHGAASDLDYQIAQKTEA